MAQLHHLVGAILRDIAQARVTSDLYSREVSRYYEQDSLLRLFPIPRTEIKEVEIELKFAISEIVIDPDRTDDRSAKFSGIFERYSDLFTETVFNVMASTKADNTGWQNLVAGFDTPGNRLALKAEIVNYFESNKDKLIKEETTSDGPGQVNTNLTFDTDAAKTAVTAAKGVIEKSVYSQLNNSISTIQKGSDALAAAKSAITKQIGVQLTSLGNDIEYVEAAEYKAEVVIMAEELQKLPVEAISSIKIVTSMRNYVWSQVGDKDGQVIRRLIPE